MIKQSIISYFSQIKDSKILHKQLHPLENIVFITIAGMMSGCDSWNDMEDYGNAKKE
ncbi:MAG: transposase family protein [Paludibacteraceae bacterium]